VPHDEFTLPMQEVSNILGVTIWTLREWRKKNYFPEPVHRLGRLWFSSTQVQWLERLKDFLVSKGLRVRNADRKELDELVALIYSNWN
jgi:DNA-binding transcriptional MerR regulator